MSQKQVMPKSEDLSRSLEINAIWTFDTEFPTIFNKSCTYITFKSAVKHRQYSSSKVFKKENTSQDQPFKISKVSSLLAGSCLNTFRISNTRTRKF